MFGLRKFKIGFERIGMVAFVIVSGAIILLHLAAEVRYDPPKDLDNRLSAHCGPPTTDPMIYLCREAMKAKLRLRHYTNENDSRTYLIVALVIFLLALTCVGRWTYIWVRNGFAIDASPKRSARLEHD